MKLYKETINGIKPACSKAMEQAQKRLDSLVKPVGSLGRLEDIAIKLAGITGKVFSKVDKKCIVIMSSDNGVLEEGISPCPQAVTAIQTLNFLKNLAGINVLSRQVSSHIRVVDIGINGDLEYDGLINRKIRKGTSNMAKGPSMSKEEAIRGIETGIEVVGQLVKEGYNLLGTGEMGIGNTSTSSAILMSFTGCSSDEAVGKGIGLTDENYAHKKRTVEKAISINKPDRNDPIDVLSKVGGFDIAGLTGCFLAAAFHRIPIVIDGFISSAAALIACKINPLTLDYMIPSHNSAEPGFKLMMNELGQTPMLDLGMRLGEGTGCALAFNIIEASTNIISKMATFEEASIVSDFIIDSREN